ncbi:MAG: hypothetical protein LQ341_002900 [Variospora aurantia]|nr:MAG: hypothetical protein LQ341_002900 [Variospora aurantia]
MRLHGKGLWELEVLLALSKAAPLLADVEKAKSLLGQIKPYLLDSQAQAIRPSPFLQSIEPSPWEALTFNLATAIFTIGLRHSSLHGEAFESLNGYLQNCFQSASSTPSPDSKTGTEDFVRAIGADHASVTAILSTSLLGFLRSVSMYCHFYTIPQRSHLLTLLRQILNDDFLVSVEGTFSSLRASEETPRSLQIWRTYARRYAASGRPLGAMLLQQSFMRVVQSCSSLQIFGVGQLQKMSTFDVLMSPQPLLADKHHPDRTLLTELMTEIANQKLILLEEGADYLQLGSAWLQRIAFSTKAYTLNTYLHCAIADEEVAEPESLISCLEDVITDPVQMADDTLATVVLQSMAVVSKLSPAFATNFSRLLPRFIVQGSVKGEIIDIAARSLAYILQLLSHDSVITGLYSLGNVLSSSSTDRAAGASGAPNGTLGASHSTGRYGLHATGSSISLVLSGEEETTAVYGNIVRAIVGVANGCHDDKIIALALSILLQKLGRINMAVDNHIIREAARLAASGGALELKSLLKLYIRIGHDAAVQRNESLLAAVKGARMYLASVLHDSPLYPVYLTSLLESVISKGDVHESDSTHQADVELASREIGELLEPLATLVDGHVDLSGTEEDQDIVDLQREAWFNLVVHGITPKSKIGHQHVNELRTLALRSHALVAEDRADQFESDIELNTVLRRGMNAPHTAEQKSRLISMLPKCEVAIRSLSYPKVVFLLATYLVETFRANAGDCTHMLTYFLDPSLNGSAMENCMVAIADEVFSIFLSQTISTHHDDSSAHVVASQLAQMLTGCCHRIPRVQQIAYSCADRIISSLPSSLCQRSSLFALLELLSIMWMSCLDSETDEYDWKSQYISQRGEIEVELSDNFELRKHTLNALYKRARYWVMSVINIAPLDVKGLLQTYLAEYADDGAIEPHGDCSLNTASDFIAQYTTRQEYRFAAALPHQDPEWTDFVHTNGHASAVHRGPRGKEEDSQAILTHLDHRTNSKDNVSIGEMRDTLRRAAALLSKAEVDQSALVHHLVDIPFATFTKQSIKLGVSLWLGVINENPQMESRILIEVAERWESTVHQRVGAFSDKLRHHDPFYMKEEFAPSNKASLLKRQQAAVNLIAPHLRILQFFTSHFNATRLGSPHTQRIFLRLIVVSLEALKDTAGHPLAREVYFHLVLFGLHILRFSNGLDQAAQWRFKDTILSAGLRWFSHQPRWSFGGNRLQIKAESRLIADVESALKTVANVGAKGIGQLLPLLRRQDLLQLLLENEQMRLVVWLYPLDHERRHVFSAGHAGKTQEPNLLALLSTAWAEDPGLAVQLATRFQSLRLTNEVRRLLLMHPERALDQPDALQILLGPSLPSDVNSQLRVKTQKHQVFSADNTQYLLYWAPVNPITAATYFLPDYGNHPFVLQYAMRALESHSVDVTFFYVPQIVQALRYDVLGYVQRYIIETAKFSQLFAHQIIWNMKANAYRDEDSSIEDTLKPTLDAVMNNMVASFSGTDKAFYEREFSFFNEITDISGKLRPFIKKTKAEKKQKIEEELRKIKVEIGVYLPSNPEGTVIGIDRKSGKPLQSHAKAPYMATFRIKKNRGGMEGTDEMLEKANEKASSGRDEQPRDSTYEVWQSAIFKVGDDCRQDVLALQMIAAFRGIFNSVGLDVYVYPYRVTATSPGCGVIDVLPNSISRDMLGREAVNGLYDYFVSKYGAENSIRFQEARSNFVKSMAAYSVISYLLQFKDRHNGNIMVDDAGHILHIDFGFCFDIAPGGVRFERAPFKLTSEMVAVMGGSTASQSYRWFEELCIKAFLVSRQHTEKLCHMVVLMLGSGLPCFKPETIAHLRERFVLEKSDREAAGFMRELIRKSYGSYSTKGIWCAFAAMRAVSLPHILAMDLIHIAIIHLAVLGLHDLDRPSNNHVQRLPIRHEAHVVIEHAPRMEQRHREPQALLHQQLHLVHERVGVARDLIVEVVFAEREHGDEVRAGADGELDEAFAALEDEVQGVGLRVEGLAGAADDNGNGPAHTLAVGPAAGEDVLAGLARDRGKAHGKCVIAVEGDAEVGV